MENLRLMLMFLIAGLAPVLLIAGLAPALLHAAAPGNISLNKTLPRQTNCKRSADADLKKKQNIGGAAGITVLNDVFDLIGALKQVPENSICIFQLAKWGDKEISQLSSDELLTLCRKKSLQVLIEITPAAAQKTLSKQYRLFTRQALGGLPEHTILDAHRLPYLPVKLPWQEIISAGQAAGYDRLHFGLPDSTIPLAYIHPEYPRLKVALFSFSNWAEGRFAPYSKWKQLWVDFTGSAAAAPVVKTSYDKNTPLPDDAEELCRQRIYDAVCREILYRENGILKAAEGFSGAIRSDGTQPFRKRERSDCVMETAGALAIAAKLGDKQEYAVKANEIFKRICNDPANTALAINDPCRSLMNFYDHTPVYYASGNGISALQLAVSADDEKLQIHALRMMFALLRLTGKNGHIRNSFNVQKSFVNRNWDFYASEDYFHPCPHRQAAVWSLFLAAWKITDHKPFLDTAKRGLESMMKVYPHWKWMNDYSAELVKMLRPLAFLYRVEPTPQHKEYLDRVINDIEKLMDKSGAVRASTHNLADGLYPPPRSNSEYGTREASLIQTENDTCCDLLYTQSFALAGLHEAYIATGDSRYGRLADKAAEFLIRTQIVSKRLPELSGLWMRAFDFEMWEYYGSSADADWGAWCIESGWINAPTAMILSLRKARKGLFDLVPETGSWNKFFASVKKEMSIVHPFTPGAVTSYTVLGDEE